MAYYSKQGIEKGPDHIRKCKQEMRDNGYPEELVNRLCQNMYRMPVMVPYQQTLAKGG